MNKPAREALIVVVLLVSAGQAPAESAWGLWVKSSNFWVSEPNRPWGVLGEFSTKDECLSRMNEVMAQSTAWLSRNAPDLQITRDGDTLNIRFKDPPRLATVTYACAPNGA
jgi:hypothetical protein